MTLVLEKHIAQSDSIRGGKPHLVNSRITVSDVVIWHFRQAQSLEEIAVKYELPLSSVYAALSYYYDHKREIEAEIAAERRHYETAKRNSPSLLKDKLDAASDE